jgi:uncharacterized protein
VDEADIPHLPYIAPIDAYGEGGFRFAGMSHRGSLLCLPSGMRAWAVAAPDQIDEAAFAPVFSAANDIDHFIIGTGRALWREPGWLRPRLRERWIMSDVLLTWQAVHLYNVLLAEHRRVAAALIAVD